MEIFAISLAVFLLSCAGLSIGQWFGRRPISGGCRPDEGVECDRAPACSGLCRLRRSRANHGRK